MPVGRDRYDLTYPYVTDPNYLRFTKSLATTRAWDFCKNNGFGRAEVGEPSPERIEFECQKPIGERMTEPSVDPKAPVVDEKKRFRNWRVLSRSVLQFADAVPSGMTLPDQAARSMS